MKIIRKRVEKMKYLLSILALLLIIIGLAYGLLFTSPGNNILKPVIESKISQNVPLPTKLETFVLRLDRFELLLKIGDDSVIETKGRMNLAAQSIDASYSVDIKDLASLQKLTDMKLKGPFKTEGIVKGGKKLLKIEGVSDVAKSDTKYDVTLKEFKPSLLGARVAHLSIESLLYMLNQPVYAKGKIDIDADIRGLDPENLEGTVVTAISDGVVQPEPVRRDFNISIPSNLVFKGDIDTVLKGTKAISKVIFKSSVANLFSKAVSFDIKSGELTADYKAEVPDLDKLYFLTNQHMKGDIVVDGDIKVAGEKVHATAHSNTLGGMFDAVFENGIAKVDIRNIQAVALTDMLLYPHIFDSRVNAKFNYDTLKQLGNLHAELLNGQILPNKMSFMLQQLANFDITKEVYERTTIDTKIVKKKLISDLYMKSRLTEIKSEKGLIDLDNQTIDTKLEVKIRKLMLPVLLKGKLTSPEVKVETKGLLKSKAKEEIEKRLPDKLKGTPAGELLKGLF